MKHVDYYTIAGCCLTVAGESLPPAVRRLPGFEEFASSCCGTSVFSFEEDFIENAPAPEKKRFSLFHDGCQMDFSTCEGGHILVMNKGKDYLKLWRKKEIVHVAGQLDSQMLKFALWIGFGLETIAFRRIPVHSSCIVKDGKAYLFLGESGTGKSTHTRLWMENIEGAFLLNDDSPILAIEDGEVWMYGSPWSGKTHCYRQERYPLRGCVRLSQAPFNKIEQLPPLKAFTSLHPSCPPQFAVDSDLYDEISITLDSVLRMVRVWHLECLPDPEAAFLSYKTITKDRLHEN